MIRFHLAKQKAKKKRKNKKKYHLFKIKRIKRQRRLRIVETHLEDHQFQVTFNHQFIKKPVGALLQIQPQVRKARMRDPTLQ